jgi:hypothetical protein
MLQVGHGALTAFGEMLDAFREFFFVVLCACDIPLNPALRDGSEVFGQDLECGEVVFWFERSDCAGYGYTVADHAPMTMTLR